jgi:diaminohydroxyphosphoribosylaminopyrimidine deaminase / 5-amino-6-(5-phosphoribosylamino)uracil reductase
MNHNYYIQCCLNLAKLGESKAFPNPIVGSVVVNENGEIIGEGLHEYYGGAHAEVNAIVNAAKQSILEKCTIYVSLEPCSHYGKTPPCADLIIKHKFKRLVYA